MCCLVSKFVMVRYPWKSCRLSFVVHVSFIVRKNVIVLSFLGAGVGDS